MRYVVSFPPDGPDFNEFQVGLGFVKVSKEPTTVDLSPEVAAAMAAKGVTVQPEGNAGKRAGKGSTEVEVLDASS